MKMLLDENLSPKVVGKIEHIYQDVTHLEALGYRGCSDTFIWGMAKNEEMLIVSKDSDFRERSLLYGAPPKVAWLNIGNCTTNEVVAILPSSEKIIRDFFKAVKSRFWSCANRAVQSML